MWHTAVVLLIVVTHTCQCDTSCHVAEHWWRMSQEFCDSSEYHQSPLLEDTVKQDIIKQQTRISSLACSFLAALLLISVIVALFEVCRDRFGHKPEKLAAPTNDLRRCSLADLTVSRHARRVDHPARLTRDNRSLSMQSRSLLGARPPPLIRRSSFPAVPANRDSGSPNASTPAQDSNEGTPSHRVRLIRRH